MTATAVWNARYHADKTGLDFDAVPGDGWIRDGTHEFVSECVRALDVDGKVQGWTVSEFCSPYFATVQAAVDYRDAFPAAWRFGVRFEGVPTSCPTLPINNRIADASDASFKFVRGYSRWSERRCIVIANFPFWPTEHVSQKLEALRRMPGIHGIDVLDMGGSLTQARVDLGVVSFPEARDMVKRVDQHLLDARGATNWAQLA